MQTHFTWDPQHEALVRGKWREKTHFRLKDMENKDAKVPTDRIIYWMTDDLSARLRHKLGNDEAFKAQSATNRKNKVEGPKAKIEHSQGSAWAIMRFSKLVTDCTLHIWSYCY